MGMHLQKQYPFRTDEELIHKMDYISELNDRTRNKEIEHALKDYILRYEEQYGKIKLDKE